MEKESVEEYIDYSMVNDAYIKSIMLINRLSTKEEVFFFMSCMNLLNTYIKKEYAKEEFKSRYIIKDYVSRALEQIIENNISGVEVFLEKQVVYIKVMGRQFSFHNVRRSRYLTKYMNSCDNVKQEWSGIRLQKISVSLYLEATSFMENVKYNVSASLSNGRIRI